MALSLAPISNESNPDENENKEKVLPKAMGVVKGLIVTKQYFVN
jgi:hypothetical protein